MGEASHFEDLSFATRAIHVGQEPEQWKSMSVVPPISLSVTYKQYEPGNHAGFEYARSGNPTRNLLERCLASCEKAKYALTFSSGLTAETSVLHLLKSGDHIVCMDDVYGGTNRLFSRIINHMNISTSFVDCTVLSNVQKAIKENTKMVWLETPTNPTLKVVDIKAVADLVHKHSKDILVVVDNTFMTSYFQLPITLGADIVVYSLTKYMNGHSDVVMGAVMTDRDDLHDRLRFLQNGIGGIPSPFDCYLVNRGLKTLHLRMKEHMKNGLAVANFLEKHPLVEKVYHPGLTSHPQYEIAKKQCKGYSGMVTFHVKGGLKEAKTFLTSLKLFCIAESLGGYESLAEHPGIMTHASVPAEQRKILNISDTLIRLSVGLEAEEDIIADLDQALKKTVE